VIGVIFKELMMLANAQILIWLREQQRSLTNIAAQVSASAFAKVWDNPDDEAYDAL
jgi:hypothetical protein